MDYRTLEATVILSCLVVLVTVSALPWKTVNNRQAKVEIKDAYFMGIHHVSKKGKVYVGNLEYFYFEKV